MGNVSGDLGNARFRWVCTSAGDLACDAGDAFPRHVALGSTYALDFSHSSAVPDAVRAGSIEAASHTRASLISGNRFEANEEGRVTLVALSVDNFVIDYTTIEQRPVQDLSLVASETDPFLDCEWNTQACDPNAEVEYWPLTFIPGESTFVRAEPLTFSGFQLLGDLDYDWEASPNAVASVGGTNGNRAQIDVHAPGVFEIWVRAGDYEETFHYRVDSVGEGPRRRKPEPEDTGTGGETEGGDTESGSGSSMGETDTDQSGTTMGGSTTGGAR